MTKATFQCVVSSEFDVLWKVLMDEIEHPENYNPGIKAVEIIERFNNGVLRCVSVPDADVRERVEFKYDQGLIVSTMVGHPQLEGVIKRTISKADDGLVLESQVEWQSVDQKVDQMLRRNVENFVMNGFGQVKVVAEAGN